MGELVPIVEGRSEVEAVPVLLRRVLRRLKRFDLAIGRPVRVPRSKVVKPAELAKALALATRTRPHCRAILVMLDADDDCPRELGPDLKARAAASVGCPVEVILAKREFEAWFLGSVESLRGYRGIGADAASPPDVETIRGAKERLTSLMLGGRTYLPIDDQPAMAERFDMDRAAANSPSFRRLLEKVQRLLAELT